MLREPELCRALSYSNKKVKPIFNSLLDIEDKQYLQECYDTNYYDTNPFNVCIWCADFRHIVQTKLILDLSVLDLYRS